jgi:hypothetical protein
LRDALLDAHIALIPQPNLNEKTQRVLEVSPRGIPATKRLEGMSEVQPEELGLLLATPDRLRITLWTVPVPNPVRHRTLLRKPENLIGSPRLDGSSRAI